MKTLLSSNSLIVALLAIALTGCGGGSSSKKSESSAAASSTPSSVASSTPSSVASSMPSSVASSVPSSAASSESSSASSVASAALVIYEEDEIPAWHLWDCCGGTTPVAVVSAEVEHGKAAEFAIHGSTVVGFTARNGDGAVGGAPFDATSIKTTGTIKFDLKMTHAPTAGVGTWKFKVESPAAATHVEVNLSTSQEGLTAPVLNTWQTYTFNLSTLETAGLDVAHLELFMVFPAWGTGDGAIFQVDNVKILATGAQ